jgi:all-trans-retinol dehydrogenase (NAD+)
MLAQNSGHIVNVASIAGQVGGCSLTDYCASKFADVGFTESLCYELAATNKNIHITTVCPYLISTGLFDGFQIRLVFNLCEKFGLKFNFNRFPSLLPPLEPEYTAKRIVRGVLSNQKILIIPRLMYWMVLFKA